jgi:hypothetical protein
MALDTYANLGAAVADWLNRTDLSVPILDFITLAEAKIRRQVRRKTVRATMTISSESTALPVDLAELRSAYPMTGSVALDQPLVQGTPEILATIRASANGVAGRPQAVAVIDDQLVVAPVPDQTYTLQITYYQTLAPLSMANPSNSILAEAPDIYLYGALAEAEPYLEHDERIATWKGLYNDAVTDLNNVREKEESTMSWKRARLPVVF